ncbi:MAG: hypothetical protein ACTSPW_00090 [Promethearchaeota archaeon]
MGYKKVDKDLKVKDRGDGKVDSIYIFGSKDGKHEHVVVDKEKGIIYRGIKKNK